jgi:diguanylate cyclase (GGDEF)-like protein/PAS domain S-box-containing protein
MISAPLPYDEDTRLAALHALDILDTEPEIEFDALTRAASLICQVPISLISLIDSERQWFKANVGLPNTTETSRDMAFCAHTILSDEVMIVPDAHIDPHFIDNPLVTEDTQFRFYAGAPICLSDGSRIGVLCVIDRKPGHLQPVQIEILRCLAQVAAKTLEGRRATRLLKQTIQAEQASQKRFKELSESTPGGVFYTDASGACTYANQAWQEFFGLNLEQSLGNGWCLVVHPEERVHILTAWSEAVRQAIEFNWDFRILRPDQTIRHVHSRARPVFDDNHALLGFVGSVEDITKYHHQQIALRESEQRMMLATESGGIGIWDLNMATGELRWDKRMYSIYGLPPLEGPHNYAFWTQKLHPEDLVHIELQIQKAMSSKQNLDTEFRAIWPDGSLRHVRATAIATYNKHGNPTRMIGANWDVTPLRSMTIALERQHELLEVTLASIGDAVITTDANGDVVWLNPVAERMTGWSTAEALGRSLGQVFHIVNEDTRCKTENPVATCLTQCKVVGLANHTVLIGRDGTEFGIEDSAAPIRDKQGNILGVVLVFHDVTEARRLSGEMNYRATHDALTGLFNRTEFETRLRKLLHAAHDSHGQHALLYIDLDQFKLVNDACGHAVGDQLLQQVARLFGDTVRSHDTLARLGGDEFAIILEQCNADHALRVAQQICDRMEEFRFLHDDRRFRIGTSIGLVPVDNRWATPEAIMQAADTSCYAAKEAGRNRVHAWFDTDTAMRTRHGEMQWTTRIEQALDEGRFILFAQRIVPINPAKHTHPGLHAEVLLRMLDADGSLIAPGAFLPAAERFHLVSRIDRWVVRCTIAWMTTLPDLMQISKLSINLSGQSIGDRAFHRWMFDLLHHVAPEICESLCFEITETSAITNLADAALFIEQVRALGIRVALDDFGAGASSFGYLKTMQVDYLKIDGQFVRNVVSDPLYEAAIRCFVDVARIIGVKTVAEFVDQPSVLTRLGEMGVDFAQGYLLHKPEPLSELLGIVIEKN